MFVLNNNACFCFAPFSRALYIAIRLLLSFLRHKSGGCNTALCYFLQKIIAILKFTTEITIIQNREKGRRPKAYHYNLRYDLELFSLSFSLFSFML